MSENKEFLKAQGIYAVPRTADSSTVLIGIHSEDVGKIEGAAHSGQLLPIIPGMYGLVAGKIDDEDESPATTAARELFEERKLMKPPQAFTNSLPTARIFQLRGEKQLDFEVHGYRFETTTEDIRNINWEAPTWEIPDAHLGEFIRKESKILRPSVHAILTLLYSYLEEGGRI